MGIRYIYYTRFTTIKDTDYAYIEDKVLWERPAEPDSKIWYEGVISGEDFEEKLKNDNYFCGVIMKLANIKKEDL